MLVILDVLIYGGLMGIGAALWYGVERRTERLVNRERRETEKWRRAYYHGEGPKWGEEGWAPEPLQLDAQDADNLVKYGCTARKRIRQDARGA